MVIQGYAAIIELATNLLMMITRLIFLIQELIEKSDMSQEDKDILIDRIRKAQAMLEEWK